MTIQEFHDDEMQEIYARAGAEENFYLAVFTERMCDFLVDQAVVENYTYIGYKKDIKGMRVDAWDYGVEAEVLNLFITDFRFGRSLETLTQTDVTKYFKRAERFLTESFDGKFHIELEESTPGYDLARFIHEEASEISKIKIYILSNAELGSRISSISNQNVNGYNCSYDIWDISRLFRIESSGKEREDIVVNFLDFATDGIQCLKASTGSAKYESYLLVMPGKILADLYGEYGERLLEQNVRTFLQFRGKINKGLRNTLLNEPEMFFSFNNGLTATAEFIDVDEKHEKIRSVRNFQIVNGGQTTASIYTSMKKSNADLSNVYVQVKLSVVPPDQVNTIVPRISEYANTQNKVSAADFFSNHPFHLRIEEISRRLWAPSPEGGLRETRWYYERARGQYANAQANLTSANKKKFLSMHPRAQMFTKTDLAKFERSMSMMPHKVSLGAQKNFAEFAHETGEKWAKNDLQFNELFFKRLIAKAILFRFLDKNIMKQDWYGGYKANIVTYSIAKLVSMISKIGKLDLHSIWKKQKLSSALQEQLLIIAKEVNQAIQNTPSEVTNVTEWCKKDLCWSRVKELQIALSQNMDSDLLDIGERKDAERAAEKDIAVVKGIQLQTYVFEKKADYWKQIAEWGMANHKLGQKEMSILVIACNIPNKVPSEKQSQILVALEKRLIEEGFVVK